MDRRVGAVTSPRLNLRRDPSTRHRPIVSLPRGAEVEVLGREGDWYRVRFADQEGYVSAAYLAVRVVPAAPGSGGREARSGAAPTAAAPGFLLARADLQRIPLAPAVQIPLTPDLTSPARSAGDAWNRFGGLLGAMSEVIAVPPPAAASVLCVESGGAGFLGGRMIIRFENHVFFKHWGMRHPARFAEHFAYDAQQKWKGHRFRAGPAEPWTDFHGSQEKEWRVFEFARALDETAAMYSISMGAPQIMGFNYARIGYRSVQEMFAAFSLDVRYHILAMFDFIRGDGAMIAALKRGDFVEFAKRYNGTGQAVKYGALIQKHSDACADLLARATPRPD